MSEEKKLSLGEKIAGVAVLVGLGSALYFPVSMMDITSQERGARENSPITAEMRDVSGDGIEDIVYTAKNGKQIPLIAMQQEDGSTVYGTLEYFKNIREYADKQRAQELENQRQNWYEATKSIVDKNLSQGE